MPVRPRFLGVLLACCLLTAGATACRKDGSVSENQCIAGDWETLGYRDGVHGYRSTRLLAHQEACVEHGVVPDREIYLRGWRQGVVEYCRADNGYAEGLRGVTYRNVCPESAEASFLAGYRKGRALYDARSACATLEARVRRLEQRRVEIESELVSAGTSQLDPLLTPAERIERAASMKRLADERVKIDRELPGLREELAQRREALAALEEAPAAISD